MCRFDRIMAAFERGDSLETVASAYGLDKRTARVYELAARGENAIMSEQLSDKRPTYTLLTDAEKQVVIDQWRKCGSTMQTACALGMSQGSVRGILYRAGVKSDSNQKLSEAQKAQAVEMYVGGMTCPAVAKEMGVCCASMYKMLKRRGVIRAKDKPVDKTVEKGDIA